ncbi:MAG: C25 family cysteine peptidase [Planctomycetota bacterium]
MNTTTQLIKQRGYTWSKILVLVAFMLAINSRTFAADLTWDITPGTVGAGNSAVNGGAGTWNTTNGNWTADLGVNNVAFVSGTDTAAFTAAGAKVTLGLAINAVEARISNTGYTFDLDSVAGTANNLTFSKLTGVNGSGTPSAFTVLMDTAAGSVSGTFTVQVNTGDSIDNVNTPISLTNNQNTGGSLILNKTGTGILKVSGTLAGNGGSGAGRLAFSVNGGTLDIGSATTTGLNATGNLTLNNSGSTFDLRSKSITVGSFAGAAGTIVTTSGTASTLTVSSGNAASTVASNLSGALTLNKTDSGSVATLNITGQVNITGSVAGARGLTLNNATSMVIGGTVSTSNNGGVTLSNSATMGALAMNGTGVLALGANTLTIGSAATNSTIATAITGTSASQLIKTNASTLTLSAANTYAGKTTISAGILSINAMQNAGVASPLGQPVAGAASIIDLAATGTLQYTGTGHSSDRVINLSTLAGGAMTLDASGASGTLSLSGGVTCSGTSSTSTLTLSGTGAASQSGVIADGTAPNVTAVTKSGNGTWTLTNANTYTGATTVSAGTLVVTNAAGISASSNLILNGGTFNYTPSASTLTVAGMTFSGASSVGITVGSKITTASAVTATSGTVTLNLTLPSSLTPGTYVILEATGGGFTGGTTFVFGSIINNTGYVLGTPNVASGSVSVNVSTGTPLTAAFWKGAVSNSWSAASVSASNWTTDSGGVTATTLVPSGSTDVTFSASGSANQTSMLLSANMAVNSLTVNDATTLLNADGNALTVNAGGISLTPAAAMSTINTPITLGADQNWSVTDSAATLTAGGIVSGGFTMTKSGAGTLVLVGANTFNALTFNAGTVELQNAQAAGGASLAPGAGTTLRGATTGGATLTISNALTANSGTVSLAAKQSSGTGNATINFGASTINNAAVLLITAPATNSVYGTANGAVTFGPSSTGKLQVNANFTVAGLSSDATPGTPIVENGGASNAILTVSSAVTGTYAGTIQDGGGAGKLGLTKSGVGNLTLSGANTYSNNTVVTGGALTLASPATLGATTNTLTLSGGSVDLGGTSQTAGAVSISTAGTLSNGDLTGTSYAISNTTGTALVSANLKGAAATLSKSGAGGTLTLSGTGNTYGGGTTLTGGTINVNNSTALGTGNVAIGQAGVISQMILAKGISLGSGIGFTLNGNTGVAATNILGVATGNTATINGTINITATPSNGGHFGGSVSGATGTLILPGVITSSVNVNQRNGTVVYGGGGTGYSLMSMNEGTTRISANNGIATTVSFSLATQTAATGNLDLAGFNQQLVAVSKGAGTATIGNSSTTADSTLTLTGNGTYAGIIRNTLGAGTRKTALTYNGTGTTFTLSGTNNIFTGDTLVTAGTLALGSNTAIQNSALDTSGAGVVTVTGFTTPTIGGLKGSTDLASVITTGYSAVTALTLNPGTGATPSYSGVIADGSASMSLTKTGAGTQTLTGVSTFTGATNVNAGTLAVNGSIATSSSVIITPGAQLRGSGTVSSITTTTGTGNPIVWPGAATVVTGLTAATEVLTVTGTTVDLSANAGKLNIVLNSFGTMAGDGKNQKLVIKNNNPVLTIDGNSVLSIAADTASALKTASVGGVGEYVIVDIQDGSGAAKPIMFNAFALGKISSGFLDITNFPGVNVSIIYRDTTTTPNPTDTTNPNGGSVTANQIILKFESTSVSPVKIADFAAKAEGAGVNLSWTCVSEYQNAGFNIYRRALESAEWVKVNPTLIAGRITTPDERKYTYFDWASSGMYEYKLESIDLSGGREAYAKLSEVVDVDWMSEPSDVSAGAIDSAMRSIDMAVGAQTAQRVEKVFATARMVDVNRTDSSAKVAVRELDARSNSNVSAANNVSVRSAANVQTPAVGIRWFSSGRIGMSSNYTTAKVTYKNAGVMLIPQTSMPQGFDLGSVALQREGRNVNALAKVTGGLLVYAPGYKDKYTDKDAIFIRKTSGATNAGTPASATGLFSSAMPVNVTSSNTVTNEYHDVYFDYSLRPYSFEPWFSSKYLTQGSSQDFNVNLTDVVSGSATMLVNLWSLTSSDAVSPDHGIQVLVNGQAIGESSWDGVNKMLQLSFTIPADKLKTGSNVVSLVTPTIDGLDSQISFLHSISVNYTRGLDGSKPFEIMNTSGAAGMYELYNVPATGAWVVDARFSDRASLLPTESLLQADGTLRVRFIAQAGGSGKYLVAPSGQENKPLSVNARQVKALKLNGTYLATGPAQFASGTQALLMKRAKEGIRGTYVDQEQLFDYYNYGRFGPDGIRNAVRSTKPTYLLLVGRTTYDYLNYEGQNIDPLCPAYLVSTSFWAQTTSDSAFGDLGRGYPEVAVGRLPVNNTTELSGAISHIVGYKGIPQSGIRLHAASDKPDPLVADFGAQLDATIKVKNPDMTWQENYLAKTYATAPEVTAALKEAANGGADLILYSGHGNAARLGADDPRILDQTSVQSWTGNTVFLQSTCTANWMAKNVDDYKSIAIQALTQTQGGISASIGTSTYMTSDAATAFMNQLLKNASGSNVRWGSVLMKTQQWAGSQSGSVFYKDLMTTEQLFGDPAMPVFTPKSAVSTPSVSSNAAGTF